MAVGMVPLPPAIPFLKRNQLDPTFDSLEHGEKAILSSQVKLSARPDLDIRDETALQAFLERELLCSKLDGVSTKLWMLSTPWSGNINPLHKQRLLGREILITEEPRLHLLWIGNRIFVKPLPNFLLSRIFWDKFLLVETCCSGKSRLDLQRAALGFLRSYHHLIAHESDLRIAQQLKLVPPGVNWEAFCHLMADVGKIHDRHVSGRYLFGELRLSRLNLYAPLLFGSWYYQRFPIQFAEYFARLYGPVLFAFALMATSLGGMQVALSGDQPLPNNPAYSLSRFFVWFSIIVAFSSLIAVICFVTWWFLMVCREWRFSYRAHRCRQTKLKVDMS